MSRFRGFTVRENRRPFVTSLQSARCLPALFRCTILVINTRIWSSPSLSLEWPLKRHRTVAFPLKARPLISTVPSLRNQPSASLASRNKITFLLRYKESSNLPEAMIARFGHFCDEVKGQITQASGKARQRGINEQSRVRAWAEIASAIKASAVYYRVAAREIARLRSVQTRLSNFSCIRSS